MIDVGVRGGVPEDRKGLGKYRLEGQRIGTRVGFDCGAHTTDEAMSEQGCFVSQGELPLLILPLLVVKDASLPGDFDSEVSCLLREMGKQREGLDASLIRQPHGTYHALHIQTTERGLGSQCWRP